MQKLKKFILVLLPLMILGFLIFSLVFPSPTRYAKSFMKNMIHNRLNLAYEMTTLEFHEVVDFSAFSELTEALAVDSIQSYKINSLEIYKDVADKSAKLEIQLFYPEFEPEVIDITLHKEGRKWKINTVNTDSDIYEQLEV